jgi:hypothetical protein
MKRTTYRFASVLLLLLVTGAVFAQDESGRSSGGRGGQGAGEYAGSRPPEGATPEEKRAFYQKRAAERAKAEESGGNTPAQVGGGRPSDAQIAEWRAKREAREGAATPPSTSTPVATRHQHDEAAIKTTVSAAPEKPAATKPEEKTRVSGRPGGMSTRGGSGTMWISDMPPMRGDSVRPEGSRGGGMPGMDMGGAPRAKRLWLRSGTDPQKSSFYREDADAATERLLVTPHGKPEGEPLPPPEDGRKNLSFEMPAQGFYRLYVTTRKLQGEILGVSVAKAEIGNFTHDADDDERTKAVLGNRVLESAPIEIVRERQPNESPFSRLLSGDNQTFIVLQKGLPTAGARVRFVSHQGWSKETTSDEQGRVNFQIIRDYFPPWSEFQKRFKATFLIIAEADAAESGKHNEQPYSSVRYQATLAGSYYPSPDDYRSYAWGLGISLLIVFFCGVAIYLYRRRRVKPFQEVRFDDAK